MKRLIYLTLLVLVCPVISYSQQTLTLDEAVRTAIANNTSITTIQNNLRIQTYNIRNLQGDLFPTLSLSGNYTRNHSFSKGGTNLINGIPVTVDNSDRTTNNFSLSLASNLTLYNGFANYEQVEREKETYKIYEYDLLNQKSVVVLDVNRFYFEVLKQEQIVTSNQQNLADSQAQLERIKEIVNVGRGTLGDVYKQDVQVAQNELNLEQSINNLNKAKVDLLTTMNDNLDKQVAASPEGINAGISLAEMKVVLDRSQNVDALTSQAVSNRNDYKSVIQELKVNRIQLDIAEKILYFPTISAFGNFNINGQAVDQITNNRVASYGIQLSYPIFQGFNLDVNRQIAEVNIMQKSLQAEQLALQIKSDIKKAVYDLETNYKQVEILDRNIVSAEQDKLLSEENYNVGRGTLLDVQIATTNLNNLRIQRINAVYNFLIAQRQLDYYLGSLRY